MSKVILIGPAFPLRGGIANFNEALCRAYNSAGHECSIVSFSMQYPSLLFPGKTQYDTGPGPDDISVLPIINSVNPLSWWRSASFILKQKPDYVIIRFWLPFMGPALGSIARIIRRRSKVKLIAITDNVIPHEARIGDKVLTRYFLNSIDAAVTMSESVLKDLESFRKDLPAIYSPHPIYNIFGDAVDKETAKDKLGLKAEEHYILFFGFIRPYKGLSLLLDAFAELIKKRCDVTLLIAGEFYEKAEKYYRQIEELNIGDKVILRSDYIPGEDVKYYFSACDIVAQPYLSATQSGVTQIAYHFGRAMLVTDVGGLAETVPNMKVGYVTPIDKNAIADALLDFFENKRQETFEENIAVERKRFDWSYMINKIEALNLSLQKKK